MNNKPIPDSVRSDVQQVLSEMRQLKARAEGFEAVNSRQDGAGSVANVEGTPRVDFAEMLTQAVDQVNAVQKESSQLATAYQQGDPDVSLTQVVIASEKASVAFEAMNEVRNRLVNAYEDIMNMPI